MIHLFTCVSVLKLVKVVIKFASQDDEKCKMLVEPINNGTCTGGPDFTRRRAPCSVPSSLSIFSSSFCSKLDDNTGQRTTNAPGKDISTLYHCGSKNTRVDGKFSDPGIQKGGLSLRQTPIQSPNHLSVNIVEQSLSNGEPKRNLSPTHSPRHFEEDLSGRFTKKIASRVQPSRNTRHGNTIVLGDEEEREVPKKTRQADQVYECMKETKIYYPSRDDPESVEICYSDLECLAPESFLSSAIMNFYIRYLQKPASSTDTERHDYHFFNTYFYNKMKHDVLRKNERETSFVKFRRWWKGVNIFEKAYIFLPIHENLHWSLVIFCIPDKEDESGPILLHLDSLKLHSSKQIFGNIRSFLIEEWKVLRQGESKSQFLIADKIWQKLSRRIDEKIIEVPQQKNDYDCGLFVLYFMERFLEDVPERLKKKDLAMFGRQWFKPEEASSLRRKIRNLLKEKFKNPNEGKSVLNP
ncbi:Ubiquitin-like-specific protease 1D [Abeliophyllum distichum]|uniref:Ubiquitin-like-specific protease 1D n=1 Tax=Abeliophyllum distichum TaxID=126358 RepID=A0ABD1W0K7_9LAMI